MSAATAAIALVRGTSAAESPVKPHQAPSIWLWLAEAGHQTQPLAGCRAGLSRIATASGRRTHPRAGSRRPPHVLCRRPRAGLAQGLNGGPGCTRPQHSRPIDDRLSTGYRLDCRQEVSVVPSGSSGGGSPVPDEPAVRGSSSLGDRVYRTLRDEIVFLDLPPGAPVREVDVATRLGVGRTPVREALQRLAMNYLVEIMPGRGAFVAPISLPDLVKISEIRLNLEGFA